MKIQVEDLITQTEAAEIRGVSWQAINDLVRRGKLRTVIIGKRKFVLRSEVKAYKPEVGGRPRKDSGKSRKRKPK
jgi:predicted site-specific integrase-resolvase